MLPAIRPDVKTNMSGLFSLFSSEKYKSSPSVDPTSGRGPTLAERLAVATQANYLADRAGYKQFQPR